MCMIVQIDTHRIVRMRTNIDIDDALLSEAMKISGISTKKAMVEAALEQFVKIAGQRQAIKELKGMGWDGDLDAMREGRFHDKEPW